MIRSPSALRGGGFFGWREDFKFGFVGLRPLNSNLKIPPHIES